MSDKPETIGLDNKDSHERDRIDLNHEISGESTGRIQRFLASSDGGIYAQDKKKKEEQAHRSLLDMLLAEDPIYSKLYHQVEDKINHAEDAVASVLHDIDKQLLETDQNINQMLSDAAELPDGTKVFRSDEGGSVYTQDGRKLTEDEARDITFSDNASSYEEYQQAKQQQDTLLRQQEEIKAYQRDVLDPIKQRMNDPDNPFSKEELEEIDRDFENNMPDALRAQYNANISVDTPDHSSLSVANTIISQTELNTPDVKSMFNHARLDKVDQSTVLQPSATPPEASPL